MRASSSERSLLCPASLVLPTVHTVSENRDKAAAWGTLCHHWVETDETDPAWASPADVKCLRKKLAKSGMWDARDEWWSGGEHEVTFAIHLTSHELVLYPTGSQTLVYYGFADVVITPEMTPRDIWKARFPATEWLTGTIDYLDWGDRKTTAWVDDLKTGRWPVDPNDNKQLLSYSLVPWIAAGKPGSWDGLASITQWPRYPLGDPPDRKYAREPISAFDLTEHIHDLKWAAEHPDELSPTDEGCKFCPCRPLCPAHIDNDTDHRDLKEHT